MCPWLLVFHMYSLILRQDSEEPSKELHLCTALSSLFHCYEIFIHLSSLSPQLSKSGLFLEFPYLRSSPKTDSSQKRMSFTCSKVQCYLFLITEELFYLSCNFYSYKHGWASLVPVMSSRLWLDSSILFNVIFKLQFSVEDSIPENCEIIILCEILICFFWIYILYNFLTYKYNFFKPEYHPVSVTPDKRDET